MKSRIAVSIVAALVVVVAIAAVAAPPPPKIQATVRNLAQMPVEELQKLQLPPNAKIIAQVKSMAMQVVQSQGPDLVVVGPQWSAPGYSSALGFAGPPMQGWRAFWLFKNQGRAPAGPPHWKVNIACQVMNVPPGTPQYAFFLQRWCGFSEGTFTAPWTAPLPPGVTTPPGFVKTFTGYPLYPCPLAPNAPFPRLNVTVDSTNIVNEGAAHETNNGYQIDLCVQ